MLVAIVNAMISENESITVECIIKPLISPLNSVATGNNDLTVCNIMMSSCNQVILVVMETNFIRHLKYYIRSAYMLLYGPYLK